MSLQAQMSSPPGIHSPWRKRFKMMGLQRATSHHYRGRTKTLLSRFAMRHGQARPQAPGRSSIFPSAQGQERTQGWCKLRLQVVMG